MNGLIEACTARGITIACAESLTAGQVSAALADVSGASAVLLGGVVAYATDAKREVLGVPADVLALDGPVAASTAIAMARVVRERFGATLGLATTGVAGPQGQDGHGPGEVFVALSDGDLDVVRHLRLSGERNEVRAGAVEAVFGLVKEYLGG